MLAQSAGIFHPSLPVVDSIYSFMQAFSRGKLFLWPAECSRKRLFLISNPLCGGGRGLCRHLSASQTAWRKQSATRESLLHAFYSVTTLLHFRHDITAIRDHFQRYTRVDQSTAAVVLPLPAFIHKDVLERCCSFSSTVLIKKIGLR